MSSKNVKPVNKNIDIFIILSIFLISMILPVIIASTQSYITQYGDDVAFMSWSQTHTNPLDVFGKLGTGYRPLMLIWLFIGHSLWGVNPSGYYLLNGLLFAGAMVFLYLLGKTLYTRPAGMTAVLLYLILDGTFIMVSKMNFLPFCSEIFFITSALYCSIQYYKTNNKKFILPAIILSILSFASKEPSLLIIPTANLTYLWFSGRLNKNHIIINTTPFLYMSLIMFFIAPDVGTGEGSILQRFITNLQFYINDEITMQFRTPVLLLISITITLYYYKINKLRTELMMCFIWIIAGVSPFLITRNIPQPTYLLEANLGVVLLMGIITTEAFKSPKFNIIMGLMLCGLLVQSSIIPGQISNMQNYHQMASNNQKTFYETVGLLNQVPPNEKVFYFPDSTRQKYGMQLTEDFFRQYIYLQSLYDINITTSYTNAHYIILPSSLDIYIFQKEYPNERVNISGHIKNGNDEGILLFKIPT